MAEDVIHRSMYWVIVLRVDQYRSGDGHRRRGGSTQQPDFDLQQDMWRRLQVLPDRQRAALVLRFYEDLSEQRIAEVLGCRPGTVKSLVSRGLQALRGEMRGD